MSGILGAPPDHQGRPKSAQVTSKDVRRGGPEHISRTPKGTPGLPGTPQGISELHPMEFQSPSRNPIMPVHIHTHILVYVHMHAYVAPKDILGTFWTYPGSPGQIRERLSPTPWQIFSNAWATLDRFWGVDLACWRLFKGFSMILKQPHVPATACVAGKRARSAR